MKIKKNKGQVHPSPSTDSSSSSSSSFSSFNGDASSLLDKILPAAILHLTVVLSLEDREVLAYMITRSMDPSSPVAQGSKKRRGGRKPDGRGDGNRCCCHEALFGCDCFHCYTSFWLRWDSSPNRELIHQVIEAFEDRLSNGERSPDARKKGRFKKKDKLTRRPDDFRPRQPGMASPEAFSTELRPNVSLPERSESGPEDVEGEEACAREESSGGSPESPADTVVRTAAANGGHKGFVSRAMADVLGLLNSRFWSLWSPSV